VTQIENGDEALVHRTVRFEPYFDRPEYAEFRLGDYQHELGLLDSRYVRDLGGPDSSAADPAGAVVYWHVDDAPATLDRLLSMGAKPHDSYRRLVFVVLVLVARLAALVAGVRIGEVRVRGAV
jgi:hypothetical protein